MKRLRIVVADDHEIVRGGVRAVLETRSDWEISGEAQSGQELLGLVDRLQPDVVITDVAMPEMSGIEATRRIADRSPEVKVLILTIYDAEALARQALEAGARGLVLKSDAASELVTAVQSVSRGGFYFTQRISDMVVRGFLDGSEPEVRRNGRGVLLTGRENEMVREFALGRTTRQVAEALGISTKTVETHRSNIMRKLGLHSVSELVLFAIRNGIVSLGEGGEMASRVPQTFSEEGSAERMPVTSTGSPRGGEA